MSRTKLFKQYIYKKLGIRRKGGYECVESKIIEDFDEENNTFRYVKIDISRDKNDDLGEIGTTFGTKVFTNQIDYDEAKNDSISFNIIERGTRKYHADFFNPEKNTRTGLDVWEFEDGSFIKSWVTYRKRR
jgi:hypothetical protein